MKVVVCYIIIALFSIPFVYSQSYCNNIGFESGTFTGWSGKTGSCCPVSLNTLGLVSGRQTIMSDPLLKDANTNFALAMIPTGSNFSVKLGSELNGRKSENLTYSLVVDNNNAQISVKFAMVLNSAVFPINSQFKISILDQAGTLLDPCLTYKAFTAPTAGSFFRVGTVLWKDWTTVYFDLSKYVGQTVQIELVTNGNGTTDQDYAYVYAVPSCQPLQIVTTFCENDNFATLEAPAGYDTYTWSTGQTGRSIVVNNPPSGTIYTCTMTTLSGCRSVTSTTINRTIINPQFTYQILGCDTKIVNFYDVSTALNSSIVSYFWDFGDGKTSIEKNPKHQYDNFGGYNVSLTVGTLPSGCTGQITKQVFVFTTPQVHIDGPSQVCEGKSITLTASGADRYKWNRGDTTATISVTTGGTYEVTGYYNKGCPFGNVASVTVFEKPSPVVTISGVKDFCSGDKATLTASGADSYLWSTGETTESISVFRGGSYSVSGSIANGCTSSASFSIYEIDLPIVIYGSLLFCTGGSVTLTATGADYYEWSNGSTTSTATFNKSGLYFVTGINAKGCRKVVNFEVTEVAFPVITIDGVREFCKNGNTQLTARGASSYLWSTGATTASITVIKPGRYQVVGYSATGLCTDTAEVFVTENPIPDVRIVGKLSFCENDSTILTATGGVSYLWNTGTVSPFLTVKQPGTYSVTGYSDKGCTSTFTVDVVKESVPLAITGNLLFCTGDSTQIIATGATSYKWSNGKTTPAIFIKTAGDYSVTGTSVTGCKNTINFTIAEASHPNIAITGKTSFCKGSFTQLTAIGATNYIWSTGETTPSINVFNGGTFQVSGYNNNTCLGVATITIVENPTPDVTISGSTEFCENGKTVITANGAASYLWSTGETTPSIQVSKEGYYTVTGTNLLGCTSSYTVFVAERKIDLKINNSYVVDFSYCKGDSLTLTASGADFYAWSMGKNTPSVVIHNPGTYTVQGTNLLGCTKVISFVVKEIQLPQLTLSGRFEICSGQNTLITANGASQYLWSTGETSSSILITKGGNYSVTGTDPNKCATTIQFNVKENTSPVVSISGITEFCQGGSATLTAQGALTYTWSTGQSSPTITVFNGGTYSVTGVSANGCSSTASVNVINNTINLAVNGTKVFCKGDSVLLIATGADTYLWSTGETSPAVYFKKQGTYTLTGYLRGCSKTVSFDLVENQVPSVFITGNTSFCSGGSVTLTANGANSFQWSTGETSPSIIIRKGGTYSVTGIDVNSCQKTVSVTVIENPAPIITISGNLQLCKGTSTTLVASGATTYRWSTGESGQAITVSTPGVYTVVGATRGCESSASVSVVSVPSMSINILGNRAFCVGDSVQLIATGGTTYLWSTGEKSASIWVKTGGLYSVIANDNFKCSQSVSVVITENVPPSVSISGNNSLCEGGSTVLTALGADTYIWSTGETTSSITVTKGGNYFVVGTTNGCSTTATILVTELKVNLVLTGTLAFCKNDSTQLTVSGANFYNWSTGSTLSTIYIKRAGMYAVTGRNINGCSKTIFFTVSEIVNPAVVLEGSLTLCSGDSTRLVAKGAQNFVWSTGQNGNSIYIKRGGNYSVTGINAGICSQTLKFSVVEIPSPTISISGITDFCVGDSSLLIANGGVSYLWSTGDTTRTLKVKKSGLYTVVGKNSNGCASMATVRVKALLDDLKVNGIPEFCLNDSTRLTATGADTYLWSTGETSPTIYIKREGTYSLTGFSTKGCVRVINFAVTLAPFPLVNVSGNLSICLGEVATVTATGATRYIWSNGDTATTTRYQLPGDYFVTGYNRAGCATKYSFTIGQVPGPTLNITGPVLICPGEKTTLSASGFLHYIWSTGDTTSTTIITKPGVYTVTGITPTGCRSNGSITVSDRVVVHGNRTFCQGSSTVLTALGANRYRWSTGDTTASIVVKLSGVYSVVAYSNSGCQTTETVVVKELEVPYLDIKGNTVINTGQTTVITATGAISYLWNTGQTTDTIHVSSGGVYSVTGTNQNGCTSTLSVKISEYPLPHVSIAGNLEFCTGDSTALTATGAYHYLWNTGAKTSQIYAKKPGVYSVIGSDDFGNVTHDTVQVREISAPVARIYVDKNSINIRNSMVHFIAEQQPQVEYKWDVGDGSMYGVVEFDHNYKVGDQSYFDVRLNTINPLGCQSVAYQRIYVVTFSPNIFTPNGDGVNDLFMKGYEVKVYSRKGVLIYHGVNGWDGRYNGAPAPADTYFYVISLKKPFDGKDYKVGYVTIMY